MKKIDEKKLVPSLVARTDYTRNDEKFFHGFRILGKAEIADVKTREELVKALYEFIDAYDESEAACTFSPRHGLRAVQGKRVVEGAICFECGDVMFYGDTKTGSVPAQPGGKKQLQIFNRVLREHHIRLPRQMGE